MGEVIGMIGSNKAYEDIVSRLPDSQRKKFRRIGRDRDVRGVEFKEVVLLHDWMTVGEEVHIDALMRIR